MLLAMAETIPSCSTAYTCTCGKKWIFAKVAAATEKELRRKCACGLVLVIGKGVIYSKPDTARDRPT